MSAAARSSDSFAAGAAADAVGTGESAPSTHATRKRRRGWLVHRALVTADATGLLVALGLATILVPPGVTGHLSRIEEFGVFALALPLWVGVAKLYGLYGRDEMRADISTVDDFTGVFSATTVGVWIFFIATNQTGLITPSLTRTTTFWLLAILIIPAARVMARACCRRMDGYTQNTIVVGTGPVGRQVVRKILSHPEYGLRVVGFVDSHPTSSSGKVGGLPILGTPRDVGEIAAALDVERVIVSFVEDSFEETLSLVRELRDRDVQIDIVPRMFEAIGTNSAVHMIEGMPLVGLPPLRLSPSSLLLKRTLDVVGSAVGLFLLAPLFLAITIAIKVSSPGPVFFRQIRRGEADTTFRIYKFRTMCDDAEALKGQLVHLNMHEHGDARMFKIPDDPRVTRVGNVLRRWSIDELPQLINVLKGEMSLVGPRPLILEEDGYVVDWARKRLALRPGITGSWQAQGRSDIPFDEMTKLDYLYVTNWSLKEDIRLILLTIASLARQRGAY
jgi:exopolysaccharide biosynthesis polyprenyl glycosylphosphotransferase